MAPNGAMRLTLGDVGHPELCDRSRQFDAVGRPAMRLAAYHHRLVTASVCDGGRVRTLRHRARGVSLSGSQTTLCRRRSMIRAATTGAKGMMGRRHHGGPGTGHGLVASLTQAPDRPGGVDDRSCRYLSTIQRLEVGVKSLVCGGTSFYD